MNRSLNGKSGPENIEKPGNEGDLSILYMSDHS
jgi:hypothetical protein